MYNYKMADNQLIENMNFQNVIHFLWNGVVPLLLHCALAAAQCILIGPVCGLVCEFLFLCFFVGLLPR